MGSVHGTALVVLVIAGSFYLLWLRAIVPAVLSSEAPASLAGIGAAHGSGPDPRSWLRPAGHDPGRDVALAATPMGYLLAGAMLAIESTSIAVALAAYFRSMSGGSLREPAG
jgi:hypothetical protein